MLSLTLLSPGEVTAGIGARAKRRRLDQGLTQLGLAARAQVSLGTLKAFEQTGKASIETIVKLAFALGAQAEFTALFPADPPKTMADILEPKRRQRGRVT